MVCLNNVRRKMRFRLLVIFAMVCAAALRAELTPVQTKTRQTPTREFTTLLVATAKQDGLLGLGITELESVLGPKEEIKETDVLMRSPKWIYHLSNGRRLEVITDGRGVAFAAVVDGTKVELVWK